MKLNRSSGPLKALLLALLVAALAVGLTACGSSDDSSSTSADTGASTEAEADGGEGGGSTEVAVWDEALTSEVAESELQELIDNIIQPGYPLENLPEWSIKPFEIATQEITPELREQLSECLSNTSCETGHGEYTIGIADSFGGNGWRKQLRAVNTLQLLRFPGVKKIIYVDGAYELEKVQSNFRSLVSQGVDGIIGLFDFGDAMLPTVKQAAAAGIPVISFSQGIPSATGDGTDLYYEVGIDPCEQGTEVGEVGTSGAAKGTVAMYTGAPGNPFAALWQPCTKEAVEAAGWEVTTEGNTEWTPQGEAESAASLLSKGLPDTVIYDYTPIQFINKMVAAGEKPPVLAGGSADFGSYKAWLDAGKKNLQPTAYSVVTQLGYGNVAAALMVALVSDEQPEEVPYRVWLPAVATDYSELAPYYYPDVPSTAVFNSGLPKDILKESQGE